MNYLDRDQSWIGFNDRVLQQVNKSIPLAEKFQFIGIASSNLDEFCKVRVTSHAEDSKIRKTLQDAVMKQLDAIEASYKKLLKTKTIAQYDKLTKKKREEYDEIFKDQIFPTLIPFKFEESFFPKDKTLYIVVDGKKNDKRELYLIEIPTIIPRLVYVDDRAILIEDLIAHNFDLLLKGIEIKDVGIFRVLRNSEMILNDSDNIFEQINQSIKEREKSNIIRLDYFGDDDKEMLKEVKQIVDLADSAMVYCTNNIDLSCFAGIENDAFKKDDRRRSFKPSNPFKKNSSIFELIDKEDRLVHHPYESFDDSVVRFIKESASNKKVKSIKITLYRVTKESKIVEALLEAADAGKSVTVFIELKARFDEKNNIKVSKILREAGVNIVFGKVDIKTHCKICIVSMKDGKKTKVYSHIGTGNYNEANARIYTDYSYFTCNKKIGSDLTRFFNLLTTDQDNFKSKEIIYAPYNLRDEINELIDGEIKKVKKKKQTGRIILKCNNLTDEKICNKLVEAAEAGVYVICIVRSACILEPRKNIRIISIVGRFLEHSRVFVFGKKNATVLIGSSDLMYRNLNLRNEILLNVEEKKLKNRILNDISYFINDTNNRFDIGKNYKSYVPKKPKKQFDCHKEFIKTLSER